MFSIRHDGQNAHGRNIIFEYSNSYSNTVTETIVDGGVRCCPSMLTGDHGMSASVSCVDVFVSSEVTLCVLLVIVCVCICADVVHGSVCLRHFHYSFAY